MNTTLKHTFTLIGYKLLFSIVAFVFLASFYYIPLHIYSIITAVLYLMASYSYLWKIGKKDSKEGFNIKNVLYPIILSELLVLVFTLLDVFFPNDITISIFRYYQLVYAGLITNTLSKFLLIIPIFITGCTAYILGYKKIEIYDGFIMKLVYKEKNKGDKNGR